MIVTKGSLGKHLRLLRLQPGDVLVSSSEKLLDMIMESGLDIVFPVPVLYAKDGELTNVPIYQLEAALQQAKEIEKKSPLTKADSQ